MSEPIKESAPKIELTPEEKITQNETRLFNQRFFIKESLLQYCFGRSSFELLLKGHKIYKFQCLESQDISSRYFISRSIKGQELFLYEFTGRLLLCIEVEKSLKNGKMSQHFIIRNRQLFPSMEMDRIIGQFDTEESRIEVQGLANWNQVAINKQDESWTIFTNEHNETIARLQKSPLSKRHSAGIELYNCNRPESIILLLIAFLTLLC
jgi:hypothetical protein